MNQSFIITHYYHSGFSVANGDTLLVFDYWRGEENELAGDLALHEADLRKYSHVFVFISHEHPDHLDPVVFTWDQLTDVTYVVSWDMPEGVRGRRVSPGDRVYLREDLALSVFDSTDLGVSFLVDFRGCRFFHAGDLNYWHWREESTMKEIEEAEQEFRSALRPLTEETVDVAFFPLDPRQGAMFDAGANSFILSVKPRLLIPMHYFHRQDVATEYARTAGNRATEVLAMPELRESIRLEIDEEGYMNLYPMNGEEPEDDSGETSPEQKEENAASFVEDTQETLIENSPFYESDLPLAQLAIEEAAPHPQGKGETRKKKSSRTPNRPKRKGQDA